MARRRGSQLLAGYRRFLLGCPIRFSQEQPSPRSISGFCTPIGRTTSYMEIPLSGSYLKLNPWKPCFMLRVPVGTPQASNYLYLGRTYAIQQRSFGSSAIDTPRNPSFSKLNSDDIVYFKTILGDRNVVQDEDRLLAANVDWMQKYKGSSQLLLLPKSSEEVSKILHYCNSRKLAVVPQGGNTGLVGGSVPVHDEVIINLALMDKIVSLDKINGILVCEAGCILENLNSFLENEGTNKNVTTNASANMFPKSQKLRAKSSKSHLKMFKALELPEFEL